MKGHRMKRLVLLSLLLLSALVVRAQDAPHAYVLLLHSHTCPHCVAYIANDLPKLQAAFGDQLTVIKIDVRDPVGRQLAVAVYQLHNVPQDRWVVPMMFIDGVALTGGSEIPARSFDLIRDGLAKGGIPLPDINGLTAYAAAQTGLPATDGGVLARLAADPVANALALVVLIVALVSLPLALWNKAQRVRMRVAAGLMLFVLLLSLSLLVTAGGDLLAIVGAGVVLATAGLLLLRSAQTRESLSLLPLAATAGLVVALYLAYVETAQVEAACGMVGNCNTVQQSPYALLFGVLPLGVLGALGYVAMLTAYGLRDRLPQALPALQTFAAIGVVFSAYLTFLEPFVIGATCLWCLMSALTMTASWWLVAPTWQPAPAPKRGRRLPKRA